MRVSEPTRQAGWMWCFRRDTGTDYYRNTVVGSETLLESDRYELQIVTWEDNHD